MRDDLEDLRSKKVQYDSKVNHLTSERNSLFNEKLQLEAKQQDRANMEEKKEQLEQQINKDDQGDFTIFFLLKSFWSKVLQIIYFQKILRPMIAPS